MRVIRIVVPLAMSLAWGAQAWAATVEVIEVEVFLRHGVGYERVSGAAQAEAGDSVMAGEFGVGQIIYANGCVITVRPGTVVTVKAEPPHPRVTQRQIRRPIVCRRTRVYPGTTSSWAPLLPVALVLASIT